MSVIPRREGATHVQLPPESHVCDSRSSASCRGGRRPAQEALAMSPRLLRIDTQPARRAWSSAPIRCGSRRAPPSGARHSRAMATPSCASAAGSRPITRWSRSAGASSRVAGRAGSRPRLLAPGVASPLGRLAGALGGARGLLGRRLLGRPSPAPSWPRPSSRGAWWRWRRGRAAWRRCGPGSPRARP